MLDRIFFYLMIQLKIIFVLIMKEKTDEIKLEKQLKILELKVFKWFNK